MDGKLWKASQVTLWLFLASSAHAVSGATIHVPDHIPDSYAQAATLVTIAPGRTLNLRCEGKGTQTVLLEAGSHADTTTWFKVQPLLASSVKVCSYDRAGFGFSNEGPLPRNLDAEVADLHALIQHASLKTPLVLVGHSRGSNIARLYAQRYPADISGMVLVDPPAQDVASVAPKWAREEDQMNEQRFAFIRECEAGAEKHQLASPPPALARCVAGSNPSASAKVNAAIVSYKYEPAFWRTLRSELEDNAVVYGQPVSPEETLGALPVVVLRASDTDADAPADIRKTLEAARDKTQAKILSTTTHGQHVMVDHASHDIQLDQPEVVTNAVTSLLKEATVSAH
ncbi:alpha/beta fold hydrolase [Dyella amyloliquefaciens]|uniref:alpha/beta fold hydrolase n=1 Tax=Dyella amyloliquefaciens TaxID=1770545 RepID=UPI001E578569|nr:alpha/beta hydrolase [Dyella amyloliquefaciens]